MLYESQHQLEKEFLDGVSPEIQSQVVLGIIKELAFFAANDLNQRYSNNIVTSEASRGGQKLKVSLVILTERQAYTIALSQKFAPFNAEAQTLDELRANAKRYAPDLLKMLTGE